MEVPSNPFVLNIGAVLARMYFFVLADFESIGVKIYRSVY
jgi:hypothetical protein